jgi:hypothetical protein
MKKKQFETYNAQKTNKSYNLLKKKTVRNIMRKNKQKKVTVQ